ncbi:MerR family transcriptional regulator [Actinokineospora sp. NBRC 105648]|uniref:MerR family transcriptional regulator n=1 Tax=Actinokineospora sp. NBRC 105648 TaxID=3032206 RepID=UPI00249FB046|nr:MerR family transcriptional regulator [Actinokineospora sp. NBRC 105648]GLZ42088.1 MerR family transcriptional regulator [Actinokineospora sp. NBRC 105648]
MPVAAVARRLGVAPSTLRTWDRRYGLGPADHATGTHRRYGPADIARLETMRRALLKGAAPAEAAQYALRTPVADQDGLGSRDHAPDHAPGPESLDHEPTPVRRPGGRGLPLPGGSPAARGLVRAAMAMDDRAVQRLIGEAIEVGGVVEAWDGVVRPVLNAIAARWAHAGDCVEVEHLVNECVLAAMVRATPPVPAPRNARPVLLCCAPGETHSLPLYVLRAALAQHDIGTLMLGAAVPGAALATAVRRTAPAAVVVWAQLAGNADADSLVAVPRTGRRSRLFACGPGWAEVDLPERAERLDDLAGALGRIGAHVLGEPDSAA